MACTMCCKKIHGSGERGRIVASLGCLGGRHLKQVREEGKFGISSLEE